MSVKAKIILVAIICGLGLGYLLFINNKKEPALMEIDGVLYEETLKKGYEITGDYKLHDVKKDGKKICDLTFLKEYDMYDSYQLLASSYVGRTKIEENSDSYARYIVWSEEDGDKKTYFMYVQLNDCNLSYLFSGASSESGVRNAYKGVRYKK